MKEPISKELLDRYVKGECTEQEQLLVKAWYALYENDPDHLSDLNDLEINDLEDIILKRIISSIQPEIPEQQPEPKTAKLIWLKRSAAVFAIAASLIVIVNIALLHRNPLSFAPINHMATTDVILVVNHSNSILKQVLPDNSVVWLSPASQITYPKVFANKIRLVSMQGEGFFEVTKNAARPFVIRSRDMVTKVWGTSFLVRDRANSDAPEVSVVTGKVSVSINTNQGTMDKTRPVQAKDEVMLLPHQKATLLVNKNILVKRSDTDQSMAIWNKLSLTFDNLPLKTIIPLINAKYKVDIKVQDEVLNDYVLNADLTDFNLPEVLEVLKKSLGINYVIDGNKILLINQERSKIN